MSGLSKTSHNTLRWVLLLSALFAGLLTLQANMRRNRPSREVQLARQFNGQVLSGPAPAIQVTRKDGTQINLADLRGKVVFVNFWATWCPPCRQEMPDLEKLTRMMKDVDVPFEVLAVSSDESWPEISGFFGAKPTQMLIGLDSDKSIAGRYGTEKFPETYIVDRDGNLRIRFVNIQPWTDERIHRYLEWLATKG